MLGITKDGVVVEFCNKDEAICGLAMNCCVNCGRAATLSARETAARNMAAGIPGRKVKIACQ